MAPSVVLGRFTAFDSGYHPCATHRRRAALSLLTLIFIFLAVAVICALIGAIR